MAELLFLGVCVFCYVFMGILVQETLDEIVGKRRPTDKCIALLFAPVRPIYNLLNRD